MILCVSTSTQTFVGGAVGKMAIFLSQDLLNAGIIGGATSVTSSGGLAIAHGAGVADIPAVGWHMMLIINA